MTFPIFTRDNVESAPELLEGTLAGRAPATDNLYDAIRAVLRNRPSVAQCARVIRHLREDDFDLMTPFAHDAADELDAYRETLILDA